MKEYWKLINTNTIGPRYDVAPIFRNYEAFNTLLDDIKEIISNTNFDFVAGIDALGFVLATAVSLRFQKGLILVRKRGKIPVEVNYSEFSDYSGDNKGLEIDIKAIPQNSKILLIDEWVETGAQVRAATKLIEQQGASITAILSLNIDENNNTKSIMEKYNCYSLAKIKNFSNIL
ncbi:MAG: hypothetical protein KAS32_17900 [Candidatus Peribacteraceae bacterium]|nr:hypothetical protein [Candidatus Peribacteraceae bacterium]